MNDRKDLSPRLGQLERAHGKKFWRSLEELSDSAEFQELMRQEFPQQADVWSDSLSRRRFLGLMGASLALAGLSGCSVKPAPQQEIVPYVHPPREMKPGSPLFFATAMPQARGAVGLLVESHMGRPTKIEGNPEHPASLGATSIHHQASVLGLYDPDRSQTATYLGRTQTRTEALAALRKKLKQLKNSDGAKLWVLSEPFPSPTLAAEKAKFLKSYPQAGWSVYEPVHRDESHRAAQTAFGEDVNTYYDLKDADVVVSLGADFLTTGPAFIKYAREFMSRRRMSTTEKNAGDAKMNQFYAVETRVTPTGAKADHRLAVPASEMEAMSRRLAEELGIPGTSQAGGDLEARQAKWIAAVAGALKNHRGRCVVIPGEEQPWGVHLLAHAINESLENVGKTVFHTKPLVGDSQENTASLQKLVEEMNQGRVECLIVFGGNPVYSAPADFEFTKALQKVPFRFHAGHYQDETARESHWHLPLAHYLESWEDARAFDGTTSLIQPLIEPLYDSIMPVEFLRFLNARIETPGREIVRDYWLGRWKQLDAGKKFETFNDFWETSLHEGLIRGVREQDFSAQNLKMQADWPSQWQETNQQNAAKQSAGGEFEIVFRPDPSIYDGSYANNGWLQELPKPLTKLTWDNAAIMSPRTADKLGVEFGSFAHGGEHGGYDMPVLELELAGRTVQAPAWIMPGHADNSITVWLGYGRTAAGRVGGDAEHAVGFNAYRLRTSADPWFARGLKVRLTDATALVACTQHHHLMENRHAVRAATLAEFQKTPDFVKKPLEEDEGPKKLRAEGPLNFYKGEFDYEPPLHKWGMAIDLTACVGCNACIVACQSENNIPVVGKDQVARGREMHWIRVDRYVGGTWNEPEEFYFQPLPCMHCEQAPCEYVCPVEATVHSAEGLNDMIYNRCVGTRFCSNNCPYKVRRFNFLDFADFETRTRQLQYNPDVTVRSRGVMEKCSYCVQRLRHAEIGSQREDRPLKDGEVLTACQAVCPAEAISFGDLNQPESQVSQWKATPLNYGLLAELNTEPRTTYLGALRNPNDQLQGAENGT